MEIDAALRVVQPGFLAVKLKRQPLRGVYATVGPMAGVFQRVRGTLESPT
jgi:hypothetical protein